MTALLLRAAALPALLLGLFASLANGVFINFQNCIESSILNSNPLELQFVPLFFDATFERVSPYTLNVTIYGNVSGQQYYGTYPPPDSPKWKNKNDLLGKIPGTGDANINTTLFSKFDVLTYSAYDAKATSFCPTLINGSCPLAPYFFANNSNPYDLPSFRISHGFGSPYEFSTLDSTIRIVSGDRGSPTLACISANITPDLGPQVKNLITWLPAAILILKGLATLTAAIWSPWGSSDIFRWSSNYGRDEDLLRLVTPGFGDCLQYIQFVTLMGSLTLQFPGFFKPAVSQTAWSLLLFNESYVSHGNGTTALVDGIYATNGTYGLDSMRQLIGMSESIDIWACMAIWFAVIAVTVIVLCQLGFFGRWIYRTITKTTEEDLRWKNLPFTLGNMIRLLFNFFILPVVALSLFQLVISPISPPILIAFAVVLFVILIVSAGWILRVIFTAKPRTFLFDDMPTVLLYGPLYNTYTDSAAPFALVPVIITFMRGVAFGAVQPNGVGQIVILAVCEVILILTLNGFRPFQNQTSMNAYHTFFAVVRLITVLLCIAFVPQLGVTEAPKGWIGYVILLLHACVLVFGFFLNAAQTLVEVTARSLGLAGRDAQTGAVRGSILSWRMLKKRKSVRPNVGDRASMASNAAILRESHGDDARSWNGGRSRSISASSQQLLNQVGTAPAGHRLSGYDNTSNDGGVDAEALHGGIIGAGVGKTDVGVKNEETFRPPRPRKKTNEALNPGAKSRSVGSADLLYVDSPGRGPTNRDTTGSPSPAFFRDRADSNSEAPRTDYAVREVDEYYRGQALSDQPTRKLKTGPADPEGPAANAQSWFQKLMFGVKGNKNKDQGKGFEVVRSSRVPPGMQQQHEEGMDESLEMQTSPPMNQEPYRDSPELDSRPVPAATGADRTISPLSGRRSQASSRHQRLVSYESVDGVQNDSRLSEIMQDNHTINRSIRPDSDTIGQVHQPAAGAAAFTAAGVSATQQNPAQTQAQQSLRGQSVDIGNVRPSYDTGRNSRYEDNRVSRVSTNYSEDDRSQFRASNQLPFLDPIDPVGGIDLPSRWNSGRSAAVDRTGAQGGDNWLRAVDSLTWNHNRSDPPSRSGVESSSQVVPSASAQPGDLPQVPRRSSRRQLSADNTPTRSAPNNVSGGAAEAFDFGDFDLDAPSPTGPGTTTRNTNTVGNMSPYLLGSDDEARPSSVMNTSRHRAADSITRNSFGANAAMQASSAEIMGSSPPEHSPGPWLRNSPRPPAQQF